MEILSINPANGKTIKKHSAHSDKQVDKKIQQTHTAWLNWRTSPREERSRLLNNMATVLTESKDELAKLMALEMGKPLAQGIAEIEKCAAVCEYYATNA